MNQMSFSDTAFHGSACLLPTGAAAPTRNRMILNVFFLCLLLGAAACLHKGGAQRQTHIQHVTSAETITRGYSLLFKFDLETATFVFHVQQKLPVK